MNAISRGVKNAFRNGLRTVAVVVIVGVSIGLTLAMLIAHQAVGQRITQIQGSVGNTITVSPAGVRGFEGGGNALTSDQIKALKTLAHVTGVDSSLNDRLDSSSTNLVSAIDPGSLGQRFARRSGEFSGSFSGGQAPNTTRFTPPVTLIGTTSPVVLSSTQGGGTFMLKSGSVIDGASSANEALIGATLASKNNLTVGSTFTAYSTTITVKGIFDAGNTFSNNLVVMPLVTVQQLSAQQGQVTGAVVTVDSIKNLDSAASAIRGQLGTSADVTTSTDRIQTIIAPLQNVQTISLYSLIGAVAAGAAIIFLITLMIVRERRREIGVLKAIGAPNGTVVGQFVTEATTFTLLGALVGMVGGVIIAHPITQLLVTGASASNDAAPRLGGPFGRAAFGGARQAVTAITTVVGWNALLEGLAAAVIIAIVGSAMAAFFIVNIKPAEVLRTE